MKGRTPDTQDPKLKELVVQFRRLQRLMSETRAAVPNAEIRKLKKAIRLKANQRDRLLIIANTILSILIAAVGICYFFGVFHRAVTLNAFMLAIALGGGLLALAGIYATSRWDTDRERIEEQIKSRIAELEQGRTHDKA